MGKNKVTIQDKIDLLIKDMGKSTFLELLHFVVEVMEEDYAIKILMLRRFLDIFLEFEEIVQYLYDGSVDKKGVFLTNLSIVTYQDSLSDKKILIVDDIRLHGRALDKVASFLADKCNCLEENITFKVFVDNIDAAKVESKFNNKIEICKSVNENMWRKISSSIINSFYILGQPYVSHLPYCELEFDTEEADMINEFIQGGDVEEITTEIQKYYGVRVYLYFMDGHHDSEIKSKMPFVEQNIIRIYVYNKIEKMTIVPYAFLKPLSSEDMLAILYYYQTLSDSNLVKEMIADQIGHNVAAIEDIFIAKYVYSLETYATSLIVGKKFLSNRKIQNVSWRKEVEEYNFGCHFDLEDAKVDLLIDSLADNKKSNYICSDDANLPLSQEKAIEDLVKQINKISTASLSADRFIESYMKLNGRQDEESAKQKTKRIRGIEYLRLHKYLLEEKTKDIWKAIIKIVDSGRGTLTVSSNMINNKLFLDSLLFAGEQSPTCNESNLIYFIYPLLEYECLCQNNSESWNKSNEDIIIGKGAIIDSILKRFPELEEMVNDYEIEDLKNKSLIINGFDYYMSRYPVYEKDERLKQIVEDINTIKKG